MLGVCWMVFRNNEQKKDHLGREDYRSTPKFRQQAYYRDRWLERTVGENDKIRLDIPSKSSNHLKNAIKVLESVVKNLKDVVGTNLRYNLKVMSMRNIFTNANHHLKTQMENELRDYLPKVMKSRNTTSSS